MQKTSAVKENEENNRNCYKLFDFFACTVSDSNIDITDTKMM